MQHPAKQKEKEVNEQCNNVILIKIWLRSVMELFFASFLQTADTAFIICDIRNFKTDLVFFVLLVLKMLVTLSKLSICDYLKLSLTFIAMPIGSMNKFTYLDICLFNKWTSDKEVNSHIENAQQVFLKFGKALRLVGVLCFEGF